jgi:flagellar hook assembly protein FlgD
MNIMGILYRGQIQIKEGKCMLLPAEFLRKRTIRAINKNKRIPRTEIDDVVDLIGVAVRKGKYTIEIVGKLDRDTIATLVSKGYLVRSSIITDNDGEDTINIISWAIKEGILDEVIKR